MDESMKTFHEYVLGKPRRGQHKAASCETREG